uniref:Protein UL128 n=2 Tax=Schistosoma mansoni TaxID=6183 RepID=A0A3Q0KU79_SCHMA
MDGSGVLNCELMNLVKKRVACRDRIVELYDKHTKEKLNKMKSCITTSHEQHCDNLCLPMLDIPLSVVRINDITEVCSLTKSATVQEEESLIRQLKAINDFDVTTTGCHPD